MEPSSDSAWIESIKKFRTESNSSVSLLERAAQEAQAALRIGAEAASIALSERIEAERLQHPVIQGDADTVLLHHFGSQSQDSEISDKLMTFEMKIREELQRSGTDVPVLIVSEVEESDERDQWTRERFALVRIEAQSGATLFESRWHQREESMDAFTDEIKEVALSSLVLRGQAVTSRYGSFTDESAELEHQPDGLVLRATGIAPPGYGGGWGSYSFNNWVQDESLNFAQTHSVKCVPLVGWSEIDLYLKKVRTTEPFRNLQSACQALRLDIPSTTSDGSSMKAHLVLERLRDVDRSQLSLREVLEGVRQSP